MELRSNNTIERKKKYFPKWKDNLEAPENERFFVNFKYLPGSSEISNYVEGKKIDFKQFLFDCVGKVGNLKINGDAIENGVALSQAMYPDLISLFIELLDYAFPTEEDIDEGESVA